MPTAKSTNVFSHPSFVLQGMYMFVAIYFDMYVYLGRYVQHVCYLLFNYFQQKMYTIKSTVTVQYLIVGMLIQLKLQLSQFIFNCSTQLVTMCNSYNINMLFSCQHQYCYQQLTILAHVIFTLHQCGPSLIITLGHCMSTVLCHLVCHMTLSKTLDVIRLLLAILTNETCGICRKRFVQKLKL